MLPDFGAEALVAREPSTARRGHGPAPVAATALRPSRPRPCARRGHGPAPVAATALRPSDPRPLVAEILGPLWGLRLYVGDLAAGDHSEIAIYEVQRSVG